MAAILLCQHLHFNPKFTRNYNLDLKFSSKVKGTIRHLCTGGNFFIITINRLDISRLYLWVKTCRHSQQRQQSRAHVPGRSEPGQWQEVLGDAHSTETQLWLPGCTHGSNQSRTALSQCSAAAAWQLRSAGPSSNAYIQNLLNQGPTPLTNFL